MKEIKFEDYKRMCYSRAYSEAKRRGMSHRCDDYISASHEIFVKALNTYDKTKGAFSTHLHHKLRNLHKYAMTTNQREIKECVPNYQAQSNLFISSSKKILLLNQETLSKMSRDILSGILDGKYQSTRSPIHKRKIYDNTPYTWRQIEKALAELQEWYDGNVLVGVV